MSQLLFKRFIRIPDVFIEKARSIPITNLLDSDKIITSVELLSVPFVLMRKLPSNILNADEVVECEFETLVLHSFIVHIYFLLTQHQHLGRL